MQWMKADTAPGGIVNGAGQQMIEVNRKTGQHDQITFCPTLAIKNDRNAERDQEVKSQVENGSALCGREWRAPGCCRASDYSDLRGASNLPIDDKEDVHRLDPGAQQSDAGHRL